MTSVEPQTDRGRAALPRAYRPIVVDLARAAVSEVAPDELGLFDRRARAYFRPRIVPRGRDPLGSGLGGQLPLLTDAALTAAQTAVTLLLFRGADVLGERLSRTAGGWLGRLRRGPKKPDTPNTSATVGRAPLSAEELRAVQAAVTSALAHLDPQTREKLGYEIVGRLAVSGDAPDTAIDQPR